MKKQELVTSIVCTVLFAVILVACGGGGNKGGGILPDLSASRVIALLGSNHTSAHVVAGSGKPLMAGFFQVAIPTNLAQSFNAICDSYNPGVVPAGAFVAIPGSGSTCNSWGTVVSTVGGKRIHDPGTLSSLVVDVGVGSSDVVSCVNKVDTALVADTQNVRAYFSPDTNKVFIAANDAATPLACTAPIPAGASIRSIEVQWVKQ